MATLTATYTAPIGFANRLSTLAEELHERLDIKTWQIQLPNVVFRSVDRRYIFVAAFNQVYIQVLDLNAWTESAADFAWAAQKTFAALGIRKLERLGFRIWGLLDLKMNHAEMVDQIFGSILAEREKLVSISDDLDDLSVTLYGTRASRKFTLQLNPQTPKQAKTSFFGVANLDSFIKDAEEKFTGSTLVRDAWLAMGDKPVLHVDVDQFQEDCDVAMTTSLINDGVRIADDIARRAVDTIKSITET